MSSNQRQFTRFLLDIPAHFSGRLGEKRPTVLQQISVSGCLTSWFEDLYPGDEFRLEVVLPNNNLLPLACKAIYRFPEVGIGSKFVDITTFQQELLAKIIEAQLEKEGLPMICDPLISPARLFDLTDPLKIVDDRAKQQALLEEAMSVEVER